jgi:hypothetical protein
MRQYHVKSNVEQNKKLQLVRQLINSNPKIVIRTAIVSGAIFLLILIFKLISYNPSSEVLNPRVWFFDLNTKELFADDGEKIPPIDAPSGTLENGERAGVRAYVFNYGQEPNQQKIIAYLEKFTPEGKDCVYDCRTAGTKVTKEMIAEMNKNRLVCCPNNVNWVSANSEEGKEILRSVFKNRKGQPIDNLPKEE